MRKNKKSKYLLLLILLLGISVGYALLSTTLKINGTSTITKNTWSIYWDSVGNIEKTDTATVTTAAAIDATDNTQVNFGVTLNLPGDYYEFQVDAVNNGTVDAMVDILTTLVNGNPVSSLPDYIKYEITYADGGEILPNHLLAKKNGDTATRERVKVRIEYLRSVTNAQVNEMDDDEPYVFDIDLTYKQADDTAVDKNAKPTIDSCPDCVFYYPEQTSTSIAWAPNNYENVPYTAITGYTDDYTTLVDGNGNQKKYFIGLNLDDQDRPTQAYACGIRDLGGSNEYAFCLKAPLTTEYGGAAGDVDAMWTRNTTLLQSANLWNGTCNAYGSDTMICNGPNINSQSVPGTVTVQGYDPVTGNAGSGCGVSFNGYFSCAAYAE